MLLVWKWGGRFSGIIATSNQTWIERTVAECRLKAPNHPHEETPPPSPAPIKVPTLRLPHPSTHPASLGCPILGTGGPCRHREGLSPHGAASQGQPWVLWFGFLIRYGKVEKSFCTISWESRCLKLFQECFCCHFRTIRFWNTQNFEQCHFSFLRPVAACNTDSQQQCEILSVLFSPSFQYLNFSSTLCN